MATAIKVRAADAEDLSNVYRLMMEWHKSTGIAYPPVEPSHTIAWITNTLIGGRMVVADRAGRIVGALGMSEKGFPWNDRARHMQTEFFFVLPGFRKRGVAAALIDAAKVIAANKGMPLMMSITSGMHAEKVDRFAAIKGGIYAGGNFVFGLDAVGEDGSLRQGREQRQLDDTSQAA
jgi:GNAT superfamily N-acetyltransferase